MASMESFGNLAVLGNSRAHSGGLVLRHEHTHALISPIPINGNLASFVNPHSPLVHLVAPGSISPPQVPGSYSLFLGLRACPLSLCLRVLALWVWSRSWDCGCARALGIEVCAHSLDVAAVFCLLASRSCSLFWCSLRMCARSGD